MKLIHNDFRAMAQALRTGDVSGLNPAQQRKFVILDMADNIIRLYGVGKEANEMLQVRIREHFEDRTTLSLRTCQEYISESQILFGSIRTFDKAYWKGMIIDRYFKVVRYQETFMFGTTDLKTLHDMLADPEKMKQLPKVDSRQLSEYLRALEKLTDLLEINKADPPFNPLDEIQTIVVTNDVKRAGINEYRELADGVEKKLIEMGATKNANGEWN